MKSKILIGSVLAFLLPVVVWGQAERKYIRQGNKQYKEGAYDESEILYRKALEKKEQSYSGEFNLGDALYKQEKYSDAARDFSRLAENQKDPIKLSELYHNLGNSMLKANQLETSIEAYKEALRNNPADDETRHNLAYAQSLLQQQQQQQDKQNKEQENPQQAQQHQISKADAERMLQALQQKELKLQEAIKKQQASAHRVKVLKNW